MDNTKQRLKDIAENGLNLQMNNVMSEAFAYYKKIVIPASAALMLLTFLASIGFSSILLKMYGEDTEAVLEQLQTFSPMNLPLDQIYIYLLVMTGLTAFSSILMAGFLEMAANAYKGKRSSLFLAFKYFINVKGLYLLIIHFVVSIVLSTIVFFLQMEGLGMVAMAINWLVNALIVFVTPLIIFGNLSPIQAVKNSVMVVNKQPFTIILILLFSYFVVGAGLFFFLVGVFFTIPFLFSVCFALYRQAIGYYPKDDKLS